TAIALPAGSTTTSGKPVPWSGFSRSTGGPQTPRAVREAACIVQPDRVRLGHSATAAPRALTAMRGVTASRPGRESATGGDQVSVAASYAADSAMKFLPSNRSHTDRALPRPSKTMCGEPTWSATAEIARALLQGRPARRIAAWIVQRLPCACVHTTATSPRLSAATSGTTASPLEVERIFAGSHPGAAAPDAVAASGSAARHPASSESLAAIEKRGDSTWPLRCELDNGSVSVGERPAARAGRPPSLGRDRLQHGLGDVEVRVHVLHVVVLLERVHEPQELPRRGLVLDPDRGLRHERHLDRLDRESRSLDR